jgi:glycine/D-amino acid oxidase-like deaminating enzyme
MTIKPHIVVVGAGAFGGWTALHLLRKGARVTMVDSWGPGNSRASSGGETRIIRGAYGSDLHCTKLAARALELWREHEAAWKRKFFFPIGVLWMAEADDTYERASLLCLKDVGLPFEQLAANELARRWPQINFDNVKWGIYESESGYLLARASTQAVVEQFIAEGGEYRQTTVEASDLESGDWNSLRLPDGLTLTADSYIFACGPWLGKMFPQTVGPRFISTKQEIFFFGTPAGDPRYNEGNVPVWGDHSDHFMYGIPGNQGRGFKLADDTRGPEFDPTSGERLVSEEGLSSVRRYMTHRFPGMKDAPLLETRVCQYENTSDNNFIIDRHPVHANVWIVGGGSGHGFKHGPAIGEMVANLVLGEGTPDAFYRLARFDSAQLVAGP